MKTSTFFKMLAIISVLGSFIIPIATAESVVSSTDLDPPNYYRQNRQLVTIEVTKVDGSKVNLGVPFMSVELEQRKRPSGPDLLWCSLLTHYSDAFLGQPVLVGIAAQITESSVTNFTTSDIICLLFDEFFDPTVRVTDTFFQFANSTNGLDIVAVGCGTPDSLAYKGAAQPTAKEKSRTAN
jgi:hypothetical protein